jgi:hypothetical protein
MILSTEEGLRLLPRWLATIALPRLERVFSAYPQGQVAYLLGAGNISVVLHR